MSFKYDHSRIPQTVKYQKLGNPFFTFPETLQFFNV